MRHAPSGPCTFRSPFASLLPLAPSSRRNFRRWRGGSGRGRTRRAGALGKRGQRASTTRALAKPSGPVWDDAARLSSRFPSTSGIRFDEPMNGMAIRGSSKSPTSFRHFFGRCEDSRGSQRRPPPLAPLSSVRLDNLAAAPVTPTSARRFSSRPLVLGRLSWSARVREFGRWEVTRDEVIEFASRFDPQPFHLDDAAAARGSLFGRLAASGWHTCAMAMRMNCDAYLLDAASLGSPGLERAAMAAAGVFQAMSCACGSDRARDWRGLASRPGVGVVRSRSRNAQPGRHRRARRWEGAGLSSGAVAQGPTRAVGRRFCCVAHRRRATAAAGGGRRDNDGLAEPPATCLLALAGRRRRRQRTFMAMNPAHAITEVEGPTEAFSLCPAASCRRGTRLRDYEITGLIGEGGFGIVYLARRPLAAAQGRHQGVHARRDGLRACAGSSAIVHQVRSPSRRPSRPV